MLIPVEIADQDAQYIMAAFSEGYSLKITDEETGALIDNPVSQQDFALYNVLVLLKKHVSEYLQRKAIGEANQIVESARLAAIDQANKINITIQNS